MTRHLTFLAPAAILSAWAVVMAHTVASGHIARLLSPLFRNYVIAAVILLGILSVLHLLLYQPESFSSTRVAVSGRVRQLGRWLLLLVPVVAAPMLAPAELSAGTLEKRGLGPDGAAAMPRWKDVNDRSVKEALAADPNQPAPVEVTDLIALSHSPAQLKAFDGRPVHCVGRLFAGPNGGPPQLVRLIMWCCAADAQPASVELTGDVKGSWKDTDWLEVTGIARFPERAGKTVPVIEAQDVKLTQEPDEPYLSP